MTLEPFAPIVGVKQVEDAAIAWIMGLERFAGRSPVDKRWERSFPADIESPPRIIEVKAIGGNARGADLPIEVRQYHRAMAQPDTFFLYVVDQITQGNPAVFRLKVVSGEQLARLLARIRESRYYSLPVPVREFDAAPGIEAL